MVEMNKNIGIVLRKVAGCKKIIKSEEETVEYSDCKNKAILEKGILVISIGLLNRAK